MHDNRGNPPDDTRYGHHNHNAIPEPQYNKYLLVDNIQCHHTKGIMLLNWPRRAIFVEIAFGNLRKNHIQHVHFSREIVVEKVDPETIEMAAQKSIGEVYLQK